MYVGDYDIIYNIFKVFDDLDKLLDNMVIKKIRLYKKNYSINISGKVLILRL